MPNHPITDASQGHSNSVPKNPKRDYDAAIGCLVEVLNRNGKNVDDYKVKQWFQATCAKYDGGKEEDSRETICQITRDFEKDWDYKPNVHLPERHGDKVTLGKRIALAYESKKELDQQNQSAP